MMFVSIWPWVYIYCISIFVKIGIFASLITFILSRVSCSKFVYLYRWIVGEIGATTFGGGVGAIEGLKLLSCLDIFG